MVTEEELQEKYAQFDTESLLEIATNKYSFIELANSVALKELRKRKIPEQEIRNYKPVMVKNIDPLTRQNCLIDLNIFYKIFFYFIFIPRLRAYFTYNYAPNGYLLKLNQSYYYSVIGFSFLLLSTLIIAYSKINFFILWCPGFIPGYLFDIGFNKSRQIKNLQEALDKNELPFGHKV
ncbi:MAG: hypothetical protein JST19_11860 [Bacteroidetes bacterium]|nr:hypothetical protein [Bacteroidota bacterium]